MGITKREYSAVDAQPVVMYCKFADDQTIAYPVLIDASGKIVTGITGYRSSDGTYQPLRLDKATNTLQTIDYAHHEIHAGSHFFAIGSAVLSINNVLDFTWVMPNTTRWIHWIWKLSTSAETNWYVYENALIVNPLTTPFIPLNNNRNSAPTSGTLMRFEIQANLAGANTDTNVTASTLLMSGVAGIGRTGGGDSRDSEIIMKQGTTYCLRAVATAAGTVDFDMEWYEHVDIA